MFKVEGAAVQRSWGRIGVGMLDAQHRASVVGTEFTSHSSAFFDSGSVYIDISEEAWHGQGAKLFVPMR